MKHTRKPLSLLLALMMIVSLFSGLTVTASADDLPGLALAVESGEKTVDANGQITVDVNVTANSGIADAAFDILYDAEALTLTGLSNTMAGLTPSSNIEKNIINFTVVDESDSLHTTGRLATLTFTALKNGSAEISLRPASGLASNIVDIDANTVPLTCTPGKITVKAAEPVTTISVGSPAEVNAGDLVMVPVSISNNPGFTKADLKVDYDRESLKLQSVTAGFGERMFAALGGDGIIELNAKTSANVAENGVLFTMTFQTLKAGTASVSLGYKDDSGSSILNAASAAVSAAFSAGTVTVAEADPMQTDIQTFIKFVGGTGKLYAKADTEKAADLLAGLSPVSETYTLKVPAGTYVFEGYNGQTFLGSIELNVSEGHSDFSGDYGDHGKLFPVTIYNTDTSWVYGTDFTFENLRVVSGGESTPTPRTVTMADSVTANRKTILVHEGDTITVDLVPMGTKASSYATKSAYRTCNVGYDTLPVTPVGKNTTTVTYPYADTNNDGENDFLLEFGVLKSGTYYIFNYYTPVSESEPADGTVTATFNTAKSTDYFYKVRNPLNPDAVSYANYVKTGSAAEAVLSVTVTEEQMHIGDSAFNKDTVIRDYVTNNQYDSGDLYLATNAPNFVSRDGFRGMIRLDTENNNSCTLYPYRNWLIIEGINNAKMIEPDFHVEVVTLEGENPITVTENTDNTAKKHSYEIQANGTGTAVLFVTYDAIQADHAYGKPDFFSAIRPENTGVLVVTVNGTAEVDANMRTPAEKVNTDMNVDYTPGAGGTGLCTRKAGVYLDAELDVLYFLTDDGATYSFTPEAGTTVTMAKAVQNGTVNFSADGVTTENGVVTLSGIPEGKTIVKLVNGDRVSYQVLRATRTNLTVTDAEGNVYYDSAAGTLDDTMKFAPGDKLTLTYSKLEQPAQKLSGVYNMTASVVPYGEGIEVKPSVASSGSYNFNTSASRWTTTATIPATASGDDYMLSALISLGAYGSSYGDHRMLKYETGKSPNFTAVLQKTWFALPGVEIGIITGLDMPVSIKDESGAEIKGASITILDANKSELVAENGIYTVYPGKTYNYTVIADGKESVVATFTVPENAESYALDVVLKALGSTTWDGTTRTEVTPNADGIYEIRTGAELAWFASQVNAGTGANWNARLMNDISLNLSAWTPIGLNKNAKYNGSFDGNGHVVEQLYATASGGTDPLGLFGYIGGTAKITKLGVTGTVSYTGTSKTPAGGIAGQMDTGAQILQCFNAANVTSTNNIGGIAGYTVNGSIITDCYNLGEVAVASTATAAVGLIGGINGGGSSNQTQATMTNCYNAGKVQLPATNPTTLGPSKPASAVNCYELDSARSAATTGEPYDTVCTAAELKEAAASIGANFRADTTGINNGFPVLRWQNTPVPTVEEVEAAINAIGTPITLENKGKIDAARSDYDALNAENAAKVTNYDVLTEAEAKYAKFKAAVDAIDALPETLTAVAKARTAVETAQTAVELVDEANRQNLPNLAKYQAMLAAWEEVMAPVEIATADDLLAFADRVKGGETLTNAKLVADIDMSGKTYTPIGGTISTQYYHGTFDGNYHTIYNLVIDRPTANYSALFVYIASDGSVKNLTIRDSQFNGKGYTGAIAGQCVGTVENCTSYATVNGGTGSMNGGLVGYLYNGSVIDCVNYGAVNGGTDVGGLAGLVSGTGSIIGSLNYGAISGSTKAAGGICGANSSAVVEECANFGNVTCIGAVGGIAGTSSKGSILNCYNVATVTADNAAAGGITSESTNTLITNCYNTGSVNVINSTYAAYPIANTGTTNCFYLADSETDSVDGTTAKTAAELKALASTLGEAFTEDKNEEYEGYPIFVWQVNAALTKAKKIAKAAVDEAAGEELSEEMQAIVDEAKDAIDAAETEKAVETAKNEALDKINEQKAAEADKAAAKAVDELIDAIGTVTKNSGDAIKAAREAYDALTTEQQKLVEKLDTLTAAEKKYEELTKPVDPPVVPSKPETKPETKPEKKPVNFVDVRENDYFYAAVQWAVANDVTNGTSDTTFSPAAACTRAQTVTFLWRAAGCPAPKSAKNPFADVKADAYYYKAVLWAVENGITNGVDVSHFAPEATVSRAQVVTFLYRFVKLDSANVKVNPFADVAEGSYYYDAVLWAAENEITNGVDATHFAPAADCTRAQIVTFLYRHFA